VAYPFAARSLQWPHGHRQDADAARRSRRRHGRGGLGGAAAARQAGVRPVGLALHLANGALFGALYANVAPSMPGPRVLHGPVAGLGEHLATWPGAIVIDRLDLGRDFPKLWGDARAFAQATWRHLLFGTILGELERRLNPPEDEIDAVDAAAAASNGHGSAEHLVVTGP
jgi:hypothetical protein